MSGIIKKQFYPSEVIILDNDEVRLKFESGFGDGSIRIYLKDIYDFSGQFKVDEMSDYVDRLND